MDVHADYSLPCQHMPVAPYDTLLCDASHVNLSHCPLLDTSPKDDKQTFYKGLPEFLNLFRTTSRVQKQIEFANSIDPD